MKSDCLNRLKVFGVLMVDCSAQLSTLRELHYEAASIANYEDRLSDLQELHREAVAELKEYEATNDIVAAKELVADAADEI